jgi:IS30 family transposase
LIKTFGSVAMPGYSHLLDEERDQIAALKAAGRSIGAIAKAVGRAKSTVSRELRGVAPKRLAQWPLFATLRRRSLSTAQTA